MDEIEANIHLPVGARSFQSYARYYAYVAPNEVVGTYMLPKLDDPSGQGCEQLGPDLKSKTMPCSLPAQEGKEVGANQRAWVSAYYKLPDGDDGKCGALNFDFDAAAHRFNYVVCRGVTANLRADPHQEGFFERPQALARALRSKTPLPFAVLLEDGSLSFALYNDGTVIKRNGDGLVTGKLSRGEQGGLIRSLDAEALRPLYGNFQVSTASDQHTADLLFYTGSKPVLVSVYGRLNDPLVRSNLPSSVVTAYDAMKGFNLPQATIWSGPRVPHDELWTSPNREAK